MDCSKDCKMCQFILNELLTDIIDTKKCLICNKVLDPKNITKIIDTRALNFSKCTNCNHDFPTIFKNHDYICSDCNCKKINNGLNYFI